MSALWMSGEWLEKTVGVGYGGPGLALCSSSSNQGSKFESAEVKLKAASSTKMFRASGTEERSMRSMFNRR